MQLGERKLELLLLWGQEEEEEKGLLSQKKAVQMEQAPQRAWA